MKSRKPNYKYQYDIVDMAMVYVAKIAIVNTITMEISSSY
jgi:hypothetical protein